MRENSTFPGIARRDRLFPVLNTTFGLVGVAGLGVLAFSAFRPDGYTLQRIYNTLKKGLKASPHDSRSFLIDGAGKITIVVESGGNVYKLETGNSVNEGDVKKIADLLPHKLGKRRKKKK